ncbi:TPA: hypothetical protein RPB11_005056 [Escherichia coli]|uniref:DUF3085 domain-containing protein n=1 Tax=Escherichia TaxID=561 RepID=UPI001B1F219F|nr:DUF3085 domain-containing protein [Escherichia coli]HBM9794690.1 hypothetical protein [Escherichia albertii]MCT9837368.1 DUF3085 domain-containing protein [Escherichia coli]HBA5837574.1 hypothetical protein [Escherichia coli]HBA5837765.1 hypothetical protein [Escherichia coli]HDY1612956.1 hypothetical protein [Escherichia coli]
MTMQSELVFTDPMLNVVIAEVKRFNCPLLFVKDHGVYVMAAKGEKNSNGNKRMISTIIINRRSHLAMFFINSFFIGSVVIK